METKEKSRIPDWLKNLQENSWELELLVSGGAIFSLIQVSDLFLETIGTMRITAHLPGIGIVMIVGMLGIKILTIGFIVHLILRAFWLGLVCINYVFPVGINADKLKHKRPFKPKHVEGDMKEHIMRVDSLCGTIMFISIISAVAITGLLILFCIVIYLIISFENTTGAATMELVATVFVVNLWLYVFDLLLMGLFRRIPLLSYVIFPFFWLFDLFSFRFFYQRSLNLFSTNVKKVRFFLGALLFAAGAFVATYLSIYRAMHWPNPFDGREYKWQMAEGSEINYKFYRDQMDESERARASIQSKLIHSNYLDVFLLYQRVQDNLIADSHPADSMKTYSRIVGVMIDDSIYNEVTWHPTWNKELTNIGISAMIEIRHLSNGEHILKVYTKFDWKDEQEKFDRGYMESFIPFWKDVN